MSSADFNFSSLLHLVNASSKKVVLKIFDNAAENIRDVDLVKNELKISHNEAVDLYKNIQNLIADVIREDSPSNINKMFPSDFHDNLLELLSKIIQSRFDDWKELTLKQQVSWPQVESFSWKTSNEKCDVTFKTIENNELNVELSKETLSAMLDSLSKIREQISSVAK